MKLDILYEDKDILVCRKPVGIPVQTAKLGQVDMVSLLKNHRASQKESPEIFVVHRLDQPVEGIMVFGKNRSAAASLSSQIQKKSVDKYYWAVVEGRMQKEEGILEDYLLRDGKTNTSKVVPKETKGAKKALLSYRVFKVKEEKSLVEIKLETGRHHQIRVQMSHAGYPLMGDKKYNANSKREYLPIGLCSVKLQLRHPASGKRMQFSIEPQGEAFSLFLSENGVKF